VATHDIIVVGASAGGVEALSAVVADLPTDLPAAILVVLHVSRGRSVLPEILTRAGPLPARHPVDLERLLYGRIYVAPPDQHMTLEEDRIRLQHGPTENGVRPAIDPLFRAAARSFGSRTVGVVLTGSLDDGTAGLAAIKEAGGVTIVQDPREAFASSMPQSAIDFVEIDHVVPVRQIPVLLSALTKEKAATRGGDGPHVPSLQADLGPPRAAVDQGAQPGAASVFACPECHGTLWETDEGGLLRFRCRVGHVYSPDSMLAAHSDSVDRALWAALRSLEERAALTRRMADRASQRQHHWIARAFEERARNAAEHASVVRHLLHNRTSTQVPDHGDAPEIADPRQLKSVDSKD
jgi:two-component system chemotaxis response regulator CheB